MHKQRCSWPTSDPLYIKYHDEEWGVPVHDDDTHFEFLTLEGAQAGLSWLTILKRRQGYRRVYEGFNPATVAQFDQAKIKSMQVDEGIIRNQRKIASSVKNAQIFLAIQAEFGSFDNYIWQFVEGRQLINRFTDDSQIPPNTSLSDRISKDLKLRGMSFVGTTIVYAYLQAIGIVNDHILRCFCHPDNHSS